MKKKKLQLSQKKMMPHLCLLFLKNAKNAEMKKHISGQFKPGPATKQKQNSSNAQNANILGGNIDNQENKLSKETPNFS